MYEGAISSITFHHEPNTLWNMGIYYISSFLAMAWLWHDEQVLLDQISFGAHEHACHDEDKAQEAHESCQWAKA